VKGPSINDLVLGKISFPDVPAMKKRHDGYETLERKLGPGLEQEIADAIHALVIANRYAGNAITATKMDIERNGVRKNQGASR